MTCESSRWAYYNELDKQKAAWLRELIKRGHIAPGEVDERSIELVQPGDLAGFSQQHFFAGIGVWSYALRRAGWPDSRAIWTASCPCQPFSAAGKQQGTADKRHLWPQVYRLARECRPPIVIGEQVSKAPGLAWWDIVASDMEASGYACGAISSPACAWGAWQIRERLYWMARRDFDGLQAGPVAEFHDAERHAEPRGCASGLAVSSVIGCEQGRPSQASRWPQQPERLRDAGGLGGASEAGHVPGSLAGVHRGQDGRGPRDERFERSSDASGVAGADGGDASAEREQRSGEHGFIPPDGGALPLARWGNVDWVLTRPQRLGDPPSLRPVEPGSFPLVNGAPARVGRLRGYGDAIFAPQAEAFMRAVMEL